MKSILYYALAAFAAVAVASCGSHDHSHDHSHEHAHDHNHATESHVHSHDHSHNNAKEAHKHDHAAADVTFSVAQQKKIDFAVEKAQMTTFNGAVKVAARVTATPDNVTTVVATAAGRVHYAGNLVEGKSVSRGEALFSIDGGDVTENDAAVKFARAESDYMVAKADFERKSVLYKENAVSLKDLQVAEAAFRRAEAHYNSMKRSFNNGKVVLSAPMTGYVSTLLVDNGEYVAAGTPIAYVMRDGEVNIEAEVPVRYAPSLTNVETVNIELTDGTLLSLDEVQGRVVAVGRSANSCNMIPVTVAAKNLDGVVPGSIVTMHIVASLPDGVKKVVVPRSALVEEMGNYFVFVQHCTDAFEKREVKIGATDGLRTQILKGLHAGEPVVVKGAMSLKLSQSTAALDPHAGHVH